MSGSKKGPLRKRRAYSVGEVARAIGCANRSASRLVDDGVLEGYRLPGRRPDRRVPHDALVEFLRERRIPVPRELEPPCVLVAACVFGLGEILDAHGIAHACASTAFDAGRLASSRRPAAALVCLSLLGRSVGVAVARALAASGVPCVALASEDEPDAPGLLAGPFRAVLPWGSPVDGIASALIGANDSIT